MSYNIPSTSWSTISGANQTTIGNPLTIGTNLLLSQSGLSTPRTFTFPDLSDVVDTRTSTNSLTNKTMDAGLNTFTQLWQSPLIMRYGEMQATGGASTAAGTTVLTGALFQHVPTAAGSFVPTFDTTNGPIVTMTSDAVANHNCGLVSPTAVVGITRRANYTRVRSFAKAGTLTACRRYFGFTSLAAGLPISDTPLGNGDSGVILGFRSTDSVYNIFNNDGGGAEIVTATTGVTTTDTNYHTFEINWNAAGNVNVLIDGNAQAALTTRLPATSTSLYFNDVCQTTAAATAVSILMKGVQFETKV